WTVTVEPESCATPYNFAVAGVQRISADLTWSIGDAGVDSYELIVSDSVVTDFSAWTPQTVTVSGEGTSRSYTLTGLERGTAYYVYLRTACGSRWADVSLTTGNINECVQVGAGTSTGSIDYIPYSQWYHNSYTQQLYTAEEIGATGTINALSFNYIGTTPTTRNITVYMGTTDATSLSSGWVTPADMTEVFSAQDVTFSNAADGWFTLALDNPFVYGGGNIVVAMYMNYTSNETGYSNQYNFYNTSVSGKTRYLTNDTQSPDQITLVNGVATSGSGTSLANRNNIQFCFSGEACPAVASAAVELTGDGTSAATLTWTASEGDYANTYDIIVSTSELAPEAQTSYTYAAVSGTSQELTGLSAYTRYYVYLRANCD
ncbi:MAG: Uncharacterized protein F083_3211, partial [bacterium F083]